MKDIHKVVSGFINTNKLINKRDNLILGISGGADSMMLLHYFYTHREYYDVTLKVAHIHHGIRESAELDAKLVKDTCERYNIPFFRHDCNIKELSKERGMSEEEVGRQERYSFFISLSNENAKIVTAHNMNDQAETMMMRFFRGTDVKGLGGIPPKRDGIIIRPLLCITRKEIEEYCSINNIAYRDDETNFIPVYTRNKIRLKCTPYIEETINPALVRVLGEHSALYREQEDFLSKYTQEIYLRLRVVDEDRVLLDNEKLKNEHIYIQKRIIVQAIKEILGGLNNITSRHIDLCLTLVNSQSGKKVNLPSNINLYKIYNQIVISRSEQVNHRLSCSESTTYELPICLGKHIISWCNTTINLKLISVEEAVQKQENLYTKYIDYGKIKNSLQFRTRKPNDYMKIGVGTKKLKKIFIDDKVPTDKRESTPLIADGSEIVWIIGGRLNVDYYITANTTQVLEIQMANERE